MRQSVVAINFVDMQNLQKAVKWLLLRILQLPDENTEASVTFWWQSKGETAESGSLMMNIESQDLNERDWVLRPDGVSVTQWTELIVDELRNHLLSANRFVIRDEDWGRHSGDKVTLQLERT